MPPMNKIIDEYMSRFDDGGREHWQEIRADSEDNEEADTILAAEIQMQTRRNINIDAIKRWRINKSISSRAKVGMSMGEFCRRVQGYVIPGQIWEDYPTRSDDEIRAFNLMNAKRQ